VSIFPFYSKNSTVILDGICQYVEPARVFENCWDLAGALQVEYSEQNIQADVVTRKLKAADDGIETFVYDVGCR